MIINISVGNSCLVVGVEPRGVEGRQLSMLAGFPLLDMIKDWRSFGLFSLFEIEVNANASVEVCSRTPRLSPLFFLHSMPSCKNSCPNNPIIPPSL
jgi:hypothetical protein